MRSCCAVALPGKKGCTVWVAHPAVAADLRVDIRQAMPMHDVAPTVFFLSCLLHMHLVDGLCNPLAPSLQAGKHFTLSRVSQVCVVYPKRCVLCLCDWSHQPVLQTTQSNLPMIQFCHLDRCLLRYFCYKDMPDLVPCPAD